ncbi:hypothetical protein ACQP2E_20835 [Actinoplanes sp. CA-015351]|uniref:hypothetical protein n=1 Tax=Actinoplanes sp. CA-015351 TaxID=3239897 RepID=UPI003D95867E
MLDAALSVLAAIRDDRPLPTAMIGTTAGLARPPRSARREVGRVAATVAARMRISSPPFGEPAPAGPDILVLAALVAARRDPLLERTRPLVSPPGSAWDVVLRDALVSRAALDPQAVPSLRTELRRASPLTGVLDHPDPIRRGQSLLLLTDRLLPAADGYRLVVSSWAAPPDDPAQAAWRGWVLSRFWSGEDHVGFVLDVYTAARVRHGFAHDRRIRAMENRLANSGPDRETEAVADFWRPLLSLERDRKELLRQYSDLREYLGALRYVITHDGASLDGGTP